VFAVSAWFDEDAEDVVRELWERLAHAAIDDSLHAASYRPHITLGVWEQATVGGVSPRLTALASASAPFPVVFPAIGVFPGDDHGDAAPGVYLNPIVTAELRELHERTHEAMREIAAGPLPRHVPGRWEPHCTLAPRLDRRTISRALDLVIGGDALPLRAVVDRIGLTDTHAARELACFPLCDSSRPRQARPT